MCAFHATLPPRSRARVLVSRACQESQIAGGKHQDDADVHEEPLPESVPEEQHVDADDNGDEGNDESGAHHLRSCPYCSLVPHGKTQEGARGAPLRE